MLSWLLEMMLNEGSVWDFGINMSSLLKTVGKHCSCSNRREKTWARATLSGAASSGGGERTVHLIDIFDYVSVFVLKYIFLHRKYGD